MGKMKTIFMELRRQYPNDTEDEFQFHYQQYLKNLENEQSNNLKLKANGSRNSRDQKDQSSRSNV